MRKLKMRTAIMTNELTKFEDYQGALSTEQVKLLQDMFFKDSSPNEFKLFIHACNRSRLDPFMRQIYPFLDRDWETCLAKA